MKAALVADAMATGPRSPPFPSLAAVAVKIDASTEIGVPEVSFHRERGKLGVVVTTARSARSEIEVGRDKIANRASEGTV